MIITTLTMAETYECMLNACTLYIAKNDCRLDGHLSKLLKLEKVALKYVTQHAKRKVTFVSGKTFIHWHFADGSIM